MAPAGAGEDGGPRSGVMVRGQRSGVKGKGQGQRPMIRGQRSETRPCFKNHNTFKYK